MSTPIRPPRLERGDTVGVIAPARWMAAADIDAAFRQLFGGRFVPKLAPQTAHRHHQFAGTDAERAAAVEAMFADPTVKAIICAKGGYGTPRIVDALDYALIRDHPKILVGYSDVTALLLSITQRAGLVTYHGPMLVDMLNGLDPASCAYLTRSLLGEDATSSAAQLLDQAVVLRPGLATGRLIGGNLSLLVNMIGTRSDFDTTGAVFFLEDVDEHLYQLDRMLVHLKRAGKLDAIAALVIGEMKDIKDDAVAFGMGVEDMARDMLHGVDIPIVANFPCGHGRRQMTLPLGATVRLSAADGRVGFSAV